MGLVEREDALVALSRAAAGQVVLVAGEAGSGKTSLVQAHLAGLDPGAYVLGRCDSLRTARPLAPVRDWLPDGAVGLREAATLLEQVDLAVVEDVHWADDATLDLLSSLVRRPVARRATLLLTYRDDEVAAGHPLSLLLGDLAPLSPLRVRVPVLTRAGVAELAAGSGVDLDALLATTGGNAFFVTECLAAGTLEVPDGVRDAVLARLARVPADVRSAVEAVACVPGRCELWLAQALGADLEAVDAAVGHGLLVQAGERAVALRHELARLAVEEALAPGRRLSLHALAVRRLLDPPGTVDHARLVHHAVLAGDTAAVGEHAPLAAEQAVAAGARSQAAAHWRLAVDSAPHDPRAGQWWEALARELTALGDADAADAWHRAAELARQDGDPARTATLLARSCVPLSAQGRLVQADLALDEAFACLAERDDDRARAVVLAQACSQRMLMRRLEEAVHWGDQALALARRTGDVESEAFALVQRGVAAWMGGDASGLDVLRSGVDLARAHDLPALVAHGLSQIGSGGGEIRAYAVAVPALEECVAFAQEHELGSRGPYAQAWLGRCQAETGAWDRAAATLGTVLRSPRTEGITRMTAATALGRLRARRGDPEVADLLDEALTMARASGQLQRLWPVAAARAEHAWLSGGLAEEVPLLRSVHALAADLAYPWAVDELARWLDRAGHPVAHLGGTPFALELAGRWTDAAVAWEQLGCPYERACALAADEDLAVHQSGLVVLEQLGARPAAKILVAQRRAAGLPVARGPNAATRGTPAGLTQRELEVLRAVADGLTNRQIAQALHLSAKTVGHHVSHLLDKLQARTRAEAVARASALGIELK